MAIYLCLLVDGDVDKAAQLYKAGGGNITGANSLYQSYLKINKLALTLRLPLHLQMNVAEPGSYESYISQFVTPITTLPSKKGEVKGAGLFGALFDKDFSARD